jgi:hypothetical protein
VHVMLKGRSWVVLAKNRYKMLQKLSHMSMSNHGLKNKEQ